MWSSLAAALAALAMAAGASGAGEARPPAADFFVAANGNDRWSGTLAEPDAEGADGPFATLARARDALRARGEKGGVVLVRGGTYDLERTLAFGAEDSGTKERPVLYAAYPGEEPVLSGGTRLTGAWRKPEKGGVWTLQLPKGAWFEDLFVDGKRQQRARTPDAGFWKARAAGESRTVFGFEEGQLAAWPDASSGVVVVRPYEWVDFHLPIAGVDEEKRTVTLGKPCGYPIVPGGDRGAPSEYHVENVRAALDREGEWCLDRGTGLLSWWPPAGVDPGRAEVAAGKLHVMVSLDGEAKKDKWVEHVTLRGLTFRHSGREGRWRHYEGTAVRLSHGARNCSVTGCRFVDLGACGVVVWKECQDNTVAGNEFVRTGDTAVVVSDYLGEGPAQSRGNVIRDNHIHHCGTVFRSAAAVSLSMTRDNRVIHNLIHDMPYNGIRLGGTLAKYWSPKAVPALKPPYTAAGIKPHVPSRGNVVANNHIHHVMQDLYDGGAIYFWGTMGGSNDIRGNLIHHVGTGVRTAVGIYLDDGTDDVAVRGNVVYGANIGLHLHGAPRNLIENNVFAYCGKADLSIQPEAYNVRPMHTDILRNIVYMGRGKVFETGEGWNRNWDREPVGRMDYNLYWRGGAQVALGQGHLKDFDAHSLVADPGFAPPKPGDYTLRPGAPAGKLEIKPVDLGETGLLGASPRTKAEARFEPVRFPLSEEEIAKLPGWSPLRPTARAFRAREPVDFKARDLERTPWAVGDVAVSDLLVQAHPDKAGRSRERASASVLYDGDNLYVMALVGAANAPALRGREGTWGKDDGVEVCFRAVPAEGEPGPIYALRGYPSGKFESSTEAGAPEGRARALGEAAEFRAGFGKDFWTAEYRIPWKAAGIRPAEVEHLDFNVGVYRKAGREWAAWVGTGGENWRVGKAGRVVFRPPVAAGSANLVKNADMSAGGGRPADWHPLWWDTSPEKNAEDREPKCLWVEEDALGGRCLRIASADRGKMSARQGGFRQGIPSPGPGRYLLSYDLKAEGLAMADAARGGSFSAYVHVVRKDGTHGANLGQGGTTLRGGSLPWTRCEVIVDVPPDAKTLGVLFQFQRVTGTVWVDNVLFARCESPAQ